MSQTLDQTDGRDLLAEGATSVSTDNPTLWGLTPVQLHDRFWASRGVCVVRQGERFPAAHGAELFMLTDARTLAIFSIADAVERLYWVRPTVLFVRLRDHRDPVYQELMEHDETGGFLSFARSYAPASVARGEHRADARPDRGGTLADGERHSVVVASVPASNPLGATRGLRDAREHYDLRSPAELDAFVHELADRWADPAATIEEATDVGRDIWATTSANADDGTAVTHGRVWIGRGRSLPSGASVVGPAVLWDAVRPELPADDFDWGSLDPTRRANRLSRKLPHARASTYKTTRRVFDVCFAALVLLATLPIYPLIILAIWIEDGRPFFFAHRRETTGGREFACLKFRTMRRDAGALRETLMAANEADGPQFFIRNDPRVTRVGRFLRATNLDEIPQFLNVLRGDMSVVGPRPTRVRRIRVARSGGKRG